MIMITIVFICLAFADCLLAKESISLYNDQVDLLCADVEDKEACEEKFYGTFSDYTIGLNVAWLRIATVILNALVIFLTWLNQCFHNITIVSLPWSQLSYAFIFAASMYMYYIAYREISVKQGEVWDTIKMSGALAILHFLVALSASCVNQTLTQRV